MIRVSTIAPHFGEEPLISGVRGSGTIFLSGCSTGCFFCQNYQLSREQTGTDLGFDAFLERLRNLIRTGVHNVNYVTPDHFWPHIRESIAILRREFPGIPHLVNTSGYHTPDTVKSMARTADICLPDFKFADGALARFCMGCEDYPQIALSAIETMIAERGLLDAAFDAPSGQTATKGVLVRHLVLPGHVENSIASLKLLRSHFGKYLPLSIMNQYHPTPYCASRGVFERRVTDLEYRQVCDAAMELDFENIFCQAGAPDNDFFPDFTETQPFKGNSKVVDASLS